MKNDSLHNGTIARPASENPKAERERHVRIHLNTHINKQADTYIAPLISFKELIFEDEFFLKFKRTNITFDMYSAIPLLSFQGFIYVTRAS
jgi:hypothetical protein